MAAWSRANPAHAMWLNARTNAKRDGKEFGITVEDVQRAYDEAIGRECRLVPGLIVTAMPSYRPGARPGAWKGQPGSSISLDRISNEVGYLPENIWCVSHKGNTDKRSTTLHMARVILAEAERRGLNG